MFISVQGNAGIQGPSGQKGQKGTLKNYYYNNTQQRIIADSHDIPAAIIINKACNSDFIENNNFISIIFRYNNTLDDGACWFRPK